ncbi:hypothetical protein CB0940_09253 [Cercospora beticola]|uniref:Autophagy-related protein 101 n=1 Tax=Cercospora beticola TaxID=122368 RepID=A0A2G5HI93_CERBT|nr:hypothetical protein CB0940_09253 [Cercospora beticola]PIA92225.1 hypothetical protein CB0940_09253 [Cercospora beticola]WPB06442.1 hypothetical protein RHO25_011099 [Cercospora beticola]CAK1366341.1 unnamed protein product [Cercospora beticola]
MDSRRPPEYAIDLTADRSHVRDIVKGLLHTIFFHRYFTPIYPSTHELLDLTLPFVSQPDIEALIETRTTTLLRHLDTSSSSSSSRNQHTFLTLTLQFLERKRRRTWFLQKPDEETPWETWNLNITVLPNNSRSSGLSNTPSNDYSYNQTRQIMSHELEKATWQVLEIANQQRNHIPPITTNESNPFPYDLKIKVAGSGGKGMILLAGGGGSGGGGVGGGGLGERGGQEGWGGKMGIF